MLIPTSSPLTPGRSNIAVGGVMNMFEVCMAHPDAAELASTIRAGHYPWATPRGHQVRRS
jgi:hypothetical protein